MLGIGTILSIVGGVSEAVNIYKFGSTLARGSDAERVLGALDRIHATVERLTGNILYAPGIEGLSPAAGTAHRLGDLREARALLEPVQAALGGEIVSSGLIETPHKMERAMLENPWAMLEDIRPQHLAVRQANPDKVPVLFVHQGVRYIGWQMRGALPVLFNCELRDLPGLGASLMPEVLDEPRVPPIRASQSQPSPYATAQGKNAGQSAPEVRVASRCRGEAAVARPAWANDAGQDKFGAWADFVLGDARQRMRWIQPGTFLMGSPNTEPGRWGDEGPLHEVQLTKGFWLGDTPVTQALWTAAMGNNPSHFKDPKCPVECVSWHDAQQFLQKMNARIPGSGWFCQRRRNGSMLAARARRAPITQEMPGNWRILLGFGATAALGFSTTGRSLWPLNDAMTGGFTICWATFGNGAPMGNAATLPSLFTDPSWSPG